MLEEKMTWKLFCFSSTNLIFILLSLLHFVGDRGFPTVDPFGDTDGLVGIGCVCCQTGGDTGENQAERRRICM